MFSMFPGMLGAAAPSAPQVQPRLPNHAATVTPQKGGKSAGGGGGGGGSPPGTAAEDGGSSSDKRGRPKEDLQSRCDKVFAEFASAESTHTRFFGEERKVQMKALSRLMDDLAKALDSSSEDPRELANIICCFFWASERFTVFLIPAR